MKKIILSIFAIFVLFTQSVSARGLKSGINAVISDSGIAKNSIYVSVKSLETGNPVYELNQKILAHPASVQKMLTLPVAVDVLGNDYNFKTGLYARGDGYLIKLGADPYLTSYDLECLVDKMNPISVKKVYIDDTILEPKDWGEGWQWDDGMNPLMPKFNSYNMDSNLMKITLMPTGKGEKPLIINPSGFPVVFLNNVTASDKNDVKISRDSTISDNAIMLDGTIASTMSFNIPLSNLRRYFDFRLTQALEEDKIYLKYPFVRIKSTPTDLKVAETVHPISIAIDDVLKNSNNMVMETIMKLAGGKYYGNAYSMTGTDELGVKLFKIHCEKKGLDTSSIRLVDASGVSKNNLVDADFVTEYLVKFKDNNTLKRLPKPGEGTLKERMNVLQDNLQAKTGTLADISSIAGYVTAKSGQKYAFCIIINDPKSTNSDKKALEDYIIRTIYLKN